MRELPIIQQAQKLIRAATGEDYGDGYVVMDLCVGYAEPGYGSDTDVVVFGNWNDRRPEWGWTVRTLSGDRFPSAPNVTKADTIPGRLAAALERIGVETVWYDEWTQCSHCYRAVRTEPNSYSWTPSYAWTNDEPVCAECLRENPEWIIDDYVNDAAKALTVFGSAELTSLGFAQHNGQFENGWYPGQDDDPKTVLASILEDDPSAEVVFLIDSVGQFDMRFSAWVRYPTPDVLGLSPAEDYFDVAQGLYWYCVEHYDGMADPLYRISCELDYCPSPTEHGPAEGSPARDVYDALANGDLDPTEVQRFVEIGLRASA